MKRAFTIFLAVLLAFSSTATCCAYAASNVSIDKNVEEKNCSNQKVVATSDSEVIYKKTSINDLAAIFRADPDAYNVRISGNTLTYNLPDGTNAEIVEKVAPDGTTSFYITEGSKQDVLTVNFTQNKAWINGEPVVIKATKAEIYTPKSSIDLETQSLHATTSTVWVKIGNTTYYDIYVENQVRNATVSLLISLLTFFVNPIVGLSIGVAHTIISFFKSLESTSKYFYVSRALYYDRDLPEYHYMEEMNYYANSDFTGWVTVERNEVDTL